MPESKFVVIVVTETKKYCGFLDEKKHEMNGYTPDAHSDERGIRELYLKKSDNKRTFTEDELIVHPSKHMRPFNIEVKDTLMSIDYVSFPVLLPNRQGGNINEYFNDENTLRFYVRHCNRVDIYEELIKKFQLKVYEYDNYDQKTENIDSTTFEKDRKLEMMLKRIWKQEHLLDCVRIPEQLNPPKYDEEGALVERFENKSVVENEKTIIIVPFDKLMASTDEADWFLKTHYLYDEYQKFIVTKHDYSKSQIVEEFLSTTSKKLLFNMHYINRTKNRKFISVFNHGMSSTVSHIVTSAVDRNELGFITTHTDKIFNYQKYDCSLDIIFDEVFVFEWLNHGNGECDWLCSKSNGKNDLFTKSINPQFCPTNTSCYLRIIQCNI